jgi:hypothetical protein
MTAEGLVLDEREIDESFIRASARRAERQGGERGAAPLRHPPFAVIARGRTRLERSAAIACRRTALILTAQRCSQERNRADALDRLSRDPPRRDPAPAAPADLLDGAARERRLPTRRAPA